MAVSGTSSMILSQLRDRMATLGLSALIVPTADPHLCEYVADRYQRRAYITGFKGSAGTAVVTADEALLWTDGRYWLEASKTLSSEWTLMKDGQQSTPTIEDWISRNVAKNAAVGADPFTFSTAHWQRLGRHINALRPAGPPNIVDEIWGSQQPLLARNPIVPHPIEFAGRTTTEKLALLQEKLRESDCQLCLVSALDDIAWLFNLRGTDIENCPVFYAFAAVEANAKATLFTDKDKMSREAVNSLPDAVQLEPYEGLGAFLSSKRGMACSIDEHQTTHGVKLLLDGAGIAVRPTNGLLAAAKAVKNDTEAQGFRNCHVRDGAALVSFLAWLEDQVCSKKATLTEYEAAMKLEEFRKKQKHFMQLSFPTISSTGANAAIIHYHPTAETAAAIAADKLYLVDSGGQYLDGTTDVTRTVCFTTPNAVEREAYTLVLKGSISLHAAVFPAGTTGHRLDAFARRALWSVGLNFAHGTGHGVGSYLFVHEGPESISSRPGASAAGLRKGMVLSNEPGYYKDGDFGIRIENLELVTPVQTKYGGATEFLTFETLTVAPLCPELIDRSLLTKEETEWINRYHALVREKLMPMLSQDRLAVAYLERTTEEIQ